MTMIIWLHTTTTNLSFYLFLPVLWTIWALYFFCSLKFSDLLSVLWCNKDSELLAWFGILWLHIRPCLLLHLRPMNKTNNFFLLICVGPYFVQMVGQVEAINNAWVEKGVLQIYKFYMHPTFSLSTYRILPAHCKL